MDITRQGADLTRMLTFVCRRRRRARSADPARLRADPPTGVIRPGRPLAGALTNSGRPAVPLAASRANERGQSLDIN